MTRDEAKTPRGKCFFGKIAGLLPDHIVSRKVIAVVVGKIVIMLAIVAPTNLWERRGFLGCVGYYRKFIENYTRLAMPMTELLKKEEEYLWTNARQQAFEELKRRLVIAPVLAPPDWSKPLHVTLDAFEWCVGAILWH